MAITDLNYASSLQQQLPQQDSSHRIDSRRSSAAAASQLASQESTQTGQCTMTELNFRFSVDLASQSQPLRRVADIVTR